MSGQCLWLGTHHTGRVMEIMVGPDLPSASEWSRNSDPTKDPPLPRHFACEEHLEMVRDFMERHYQPRRMAYRDGRS